MNRRLEHGSFARGGLASGLLFGHGTGSCLLRGGDGFLFGRRLGGHSLPAGFGKLFLRVFEDAQAFLQFVLGFAGELFGLTGELARVFEFILGRKRNGFGGLGLHAEVAGFALGGKQVLLRSGDHLLERFGIHFGLQSTLCATPSVIEPGQALNQRCHHNRVREALKKEKIVTNV